MNQSYFWMTIIPIGIGTFFIRASVIYLSSRITISKRAKEIFSFIPAAILPALVAPMVFFYRGENQTFFYKERVLALLVAIIICLKSKNIFVTIILGLLSLFILRLI